MIYEYNRSGYCHTAFRVVWPKQKNITVARKQGSISYMGFRDYAPADKSRSCQALLWEIYGRALWRKESGSCQGRAAVKIVGRAWVLQSCPQYAKSGHTDWRVFWWCVSQDLWGNTKSSRNWELHCGSHCIDCLWRGCTGGGWKCTAYYFQTDSIRRGCTKPESKKWSPGYAASFHECLR